MGVDHLEVGTRVEVIPARGLPWHTATIVAINDTRRTPVYHLAYDVGGEGDHEASEIHLASVDWPELGDAIIAHPSPELTVFGRQPWARTAAAEDGYDPQRHSDFDNLYPLSGCHHTTGGRYLQAHLGYEPGDPEWESHWHKTPDLAEHVHGAMEGADAYRKHNGLYRPSHDLHKVMADRDRHAEIAKAYHQAPDYDPQARPSFEAMREGVHDQFHHLTKNMGVHVQFQDHDPYANHHELVHDVASKGRLQVLRTAQTGHHPLFTDDENDKFRAVHDFFGHVSTRRGFDRHGEEAAWVHHASMFTPEARKAMTTETRGQNAALIHTGQFQAQKIALLPDKFHNDDAVHNVKTASVPEYPDADEHGTREQWHPGDRAHYEYHCFESDDSSDADLWHHSHNPVTVLRQHGLHETDYLPDASFKERAEAGMPKTYHIRFDNGHEGTAWEDELLSHPRHFERPDPEGHIKTSGSDLGSSAVETGDSIQRPSDLGAIHDVYVPDLDIGEGIRCPLCGIRPAEVEIDHATVCKYCANYRYGVPQDDVGEPLWGQTTAAVNHDPELTLYRGEGGHDRPSYYPESGPDSKLTGAWWTSDLDKARGYAAGAGEGAQVYQIKVKPHEAPQRGLPTYHLISDQKVRDRRTLWNDSHEAAVNHPDMTWHFDVDYAQDKDALKRGEIASGTHRVVVRAPTHPQAMAMANEMVFARGSEPTAARLVHYEARQHEAMAWNEHGLGGMSAERAGATSVRHAGFKGYVGSSDEDDDDSDHHDDFDEDLWEKHRPEPTSHEQTHLDHHDEYPDSYHERHEEAYGKALEERKQEDVPDHIDDHLHHWIGEHSTDPESFTRHARQPQQVDLRKGVYATQSHVGQFHIDRYLHGGEEEPSWHSQHGGQGYGYLGEKHPLFVTHQGRLHAIEGHHRVAAALQRGDTHITGWHHDLDKHPIATDTHGSINPSDPGGPCEECHYHEHGFYPHEASLHREAAFHDVRTKAKRLRAEGKVNLLQMPTEAEPYILGQVQGDHGTYHSVIHRLGNSIYQWLCECRWGDFGPFGPDGWQRAASSPYLNRKCSHNLALLYEWQARRMTQPMVTTASFEPQDDGVFYHVTRKENRPTIERHGLDPLFGSDPHDREDGIGPGVWMWGKKPVPGPPPSGENWGNPEKPRYNAEKDDVWEVHPESHHRIERGGEVSSEWLPHEDVHVSYEHFHPHHLRRITSARDDPTEDIEDGSFEDPYPHVGKDGEPHSGVMIALVPPDHVCKDLATKDGEDPYDMHVTLAYLGKDDDVPHDKVHWAMCDLARKLPKLKGKINGFGNFEVDPEKNDGFSHVHLGLVDIPHVGEVYGHMLDSLRTVGLEPSHDHGLSPHMSIQYSHEPMEYDSMPKTKGEEFDIPHITLGYGGKWRHYPLKGSEEIEKTARGEGCPECGEEKPYHNFGCTESMAPKKYFGAQHVEALFGGHSETVCPFKTSGASKSYDRDMVAQRVSHDPDHSEMKDFDPRHLEGTQPGIQRAALQHYMGDDYKRTGQTYADPANKGNKHPVVYTYNHPVTGEEHHMLLSGHHRATAALLKGEMLHARQIRGPVTRRGR